MWRRVAEGGVERRRSRSLAAHLPPSPGHQPGGLGLQGLQPLLDLQQRLHGAGVGKDGERLWVLHLTGDEQRKAMGDGRKQEAA